MSGSSPSRPPTPTDAQIRDAIDSGATGEKVDWRDPAAAPFGTDAEAGGQATAPSARAEDARRSAPARTPDSRRRTGLGGFVLYAVVALVVAGVIALAVVLA